MNINNPDGHEEAPPAPLVEVRRGGLVESIHRGHVAAVDGEGRLVASLGDPDFVTYLRSSAKPLQALPLVTSAAADRFNFTTPELALACASHSGQDLHAELARRMLTRIGLDERALKCGVHEPFDARTARRLRERGERPGAVRNNCSGKHAGMLALALHLGAPHETYDHPDNPVQQAILQAVTQVSGVPRGEIHVGVDGCGVPVFALPVRAMALAYARLVAPPDSFDAPTRTACARLASAMTSHPELVGGTISRFDTEMMRAAPGRVVSKVGAEGVYTAGVPPCDEWPKGLGLAFKVEDGEDRRARPVVAVEALRQLGVLDKNALNLLSPYSTFPVQNHRGDFVGQIQHLFELNMT
ncbi:MAG TPA: asparaginase [Pyrinomonadaceae bacterium]|jgi:L-asparaginase II|nr:asparaginase [Pyrinomonadaceae bacterium]